MPVCSCCNDWLAIRPAGSSAPLLMRRPVLSRSRLVDNAWLFCASDCWAINELTFVLMTLIRLLLHGGKIPSLFWRTLADQGESVSHHRLSRGLDPARPATSPVLAPYPYKSAECWTICFTALGFTRGIGGGVGSL